MRANGSFGSWAELRRWLGDREVAKAYLVVETEGVIEDRYISIECKKVVARHADGELGLSEKDSPFYGRCHSSAFVLFFNYWEAWAYLLKTKAKETKAKV